MKTLIYKTVACLGIFSFFLLGNQAFGQEHPEHPQSSKKQLNVKEFSEAVKAYIDKESQKHKGYFEVEDLTQKKTLKLKLEKVHDDRLSALGNDVYFVCADFKADDGNVYDIDIFMKGKSKDNLVATDTKVHKQNGTPRYSWYEEGGVWKTKGLNEKIDTGDKRSGEHPEHQDNSMMGGNMMQMMMNDSNMMKGMGQEMMKDMPTIHSLLVNHNKIERRVENIKNGVETWTESDDPEIAKLIREHVGQMKKRIEEDRPIRQMDRLFKELFKHHDKIHIQIEETGKGVHVVETSDDPEVVKLIRQHANKAVSEFVEKGMPRAMEGTPLPEGYHQTK